MLRRQVRKSWHTLAFIHLLSIGGSVCDAQLLSAYEQAYGPWKVRLTKNIFAKRRWHLQTVGSDVRASEGTRRKRGRRKQDENDLQLFFPEIITRQPVNSLDKEEMTSKDGNDGDAGTKIQTTSNDQARYTSKSLRSVSCILNLYRNGKFTLSLEQEDDYQKDASDIEHKEPPKLSMQNQPTASITHQPLKGEWYLTPNPYCVTDRHHDELLLVSEPRMRRRSGAVEKATVELRCSIWGRYGIGAVRRKIGLQHGRIRGRMTRGTIVIVKEDVVDGDDGRKMPTREVVGTFCGKTIVDLDSIDGDSRRDASEVIGDDGDDEEDDLDFDNFDEFGVLRPTCRETG